jgi:hypothetical protein
MPSCQPCCLIAAVNPNPRDHFLGDVLKLVPSPGCASSLHDLSFGSAMIHNRNPATLPLIPALSKRRQAGGQAVIRSPHQVGGGVPHRNPTDPA